MTDLIDRGAALVVGDLASAAQTRHLAEQVNQLGRMDAVIHNAGVYGHRDREGHPRVLAVNTLAAYLLTGLIHRPDRLIYLTSDMHVAGDDSLNDLDWTTRRWNGTRPTATANPSSPRSPSPSPAAGSSPRLERAPHGELLVTAVERLGPRYPFAKATAPITRQRVEDRLEA